jgi:hypothetical protein
MRDTGDDTQARWAALGAYITLRPDVDLEEARWEVARAIAWASSAHTEWFWRGTRCGVGA